MSDSFTPIQITLSDGVKREIAYNIGSILWLRRVHEIDLLEMMKGGDSDQDKKNRYNFVLSRIDVIVLAGLVDGKGNLASDLGVDLVCKCSILKLPQLMQTVFDTFNRDLAKEKASTIEETQPENPPLAA